MNTENLEESREIEHTPGSWFLEEYSDSKYDFVGAPNGKVICQLFNRRDEDFENKVPNAMLIAAAPDLLVACQAFVVAWKKCLQLEKTDVALQLAEIAIEKATRES